MPPRTKAKPVEVKAPKEVFAVIYPKWYDEFCANCYLTERAAEHEIRAAKVPRNIVKYVLPSRLSACERSVVDAAMNYAEKYAGKIGIQEIALNTLKSSLISWRRFWQACARLELERRNLDKKSGAGR